MIETYVLLRAPQRLRPPRLIYRSTMEAAIKRCGVGEGDSIFNVALSFEFSMTGLLPNSAQNVGGSDVPAFLGDDQYWPDEPRNIEDTGLSPTLVDSIICQILSARGSLPGRTLAEAVGLPFGMIEARLSDLRSRQILTHARSAPLNDFYYGLTESGHNRTLQLQKSMIYTGPAPVPLADYLLSVEAQANQYDPIERQDLMEALSGISYESRWLDFLGPAVNSTGGIFLYGSPGNGKTTLAKCLTALKGKHIWIPHAIIDDGNIIKVFDAAYHTPASKDSNDSLVDSSSVDRRWIRVERPTVIVGGELTLDNLEIRHDARSNTCEAPLQVKSNCGSLLIDDFGRQRVAPEDLLNRWIIPLENRLDYLTLPTGKKISVPFEQTVIFSTNLLPQDLVDEAFLRRVPFKIEIADPSPQEFMVIFQRACAAMGFPWRPDVVKQLITGYFLANNRPLRRCYARDLLKQVKAYCVYRGEPCDIRIEYLQHACRNYFGTLAIETATAPMHSPAVTPAVTPAVAQAGVPQPAPAAAPMADQAPVGQANPLGGNPQATPSSSGDDDPSLSTGTCVIG